MAGLMDRINSMRGPKDSAENEVALKAAEDEDEAKAAEDEDEGAAKDADAKSGDGNAEAENAASEKSQDDEDDEEMADAGTVAQMCAEAGLPHLTKDIIDAGLTVEQVKQKLDVPKRIRSMVSLARKVNPGVGMAKADEFIRNGATPAEAGEALLKILADSQSPEIRNAHAPGSRPAGAEDHGWGRAFAKIGRKEV